MLALATCSTSPLGLQDIGNISQVAIGSGDGWIWLDMARGLSTTAFCFVFLLNREEGLTTADLQRTATYIGRIEVRGSETGLEYLANQSDFNSDPMITYVTLTHASLVDFLKADSDGPVAAEGCPAIGVNSANRT